MRGLHQFRDLGGLAEIGAVMAGADTQPPEFGDAGVDGFGGAKPLSITSQPSSARALAVANPMPPSEPVISADFP
ncbi:MAG TPA: hypothetical protein VIG49_03145 [Acetobacteraceae bacterium]